MLESYLCVIKFLFFDRYVNVCENLCYRLKFDKFFRCIVFR